MSESTNEKTPATLNDEMAQAAYAAATKVLRDALGDEYACTLIVAGPNHEQLTAGGKPSVVQIMGTDVEGSTLMRMLRRAIETALPRALEVDPEGMREEIREMLLSRGAMAMDNTPRAGGVH